MISNLEIETKKILGTKVSKGYSFEKSKEIFLKLHKSGNFSKVFTINPEFLVDAYYDKKFQKVLNSGDYNCADGFGIELLYGIKRTPGIELLNHFLKVCNEESFSLFILGGSSDKEISKRAAENISKSFPKIKIIGFSSDFSFQKEDDVKTIEYIHKCMTENRVESIDLIIVGYGHKNQEFWLERNMAKIPAKIGMGVGGSLDFISKEVKRAPKFLRTFGLEWAFRLIIQPKRIFRIFKAVILFPMLSLFEKFHVAE